MVAALIVSSCGAEKGKELSLEVRNSTRKEISKVIVSSESTKRGVRLLNIVPSGLASWYPFDVSLKGALKVQVWWSFGGTARYSMAISSKDEEIIKGHEYLVIKIQETDMVLQTGDDPNKAWALKTAQQELDNGRQ